MGTFNRSGWLRAQAACLLGFLLIFQLAAPAAASADAAVPEAESAEISAAETGSAEEAADSGATAEEAARAIRRLLDQPLFEKDGTCNILLIGADRRDRSWNGNSDTMMLASVNRSTKTIHLMSFMRDLAADVEGHGTEKLNAAYAVGGPDLLVSTMEKNFGVRVDHYVSVDFYSMADVIDQLGGVSVTVSDAEAEAANGLVEGMASGEGLTSYRTYDHGAGTYDADGLMAVAYARIRHIGNADYQRTQRQRNVIEEAFSKVKTLEGDQLSRFLRQSMKEVSHDFSAGDLLSLSSMLPDLLTYKMEEARVPFDGLYSSSGEMLVPVQPDTNSRIEEILAS